MGWLRRSHGVVAHSGQHGYLDVHRGGRLSRTYSIAEARDQLPSLVHDVEQGAPVSLTRRGKPVALLISVAEYERLVGGRTDFTGALARFRAGHALDELDLGGALDDTRDRSPGRETDWG